MKRFFFIASLVFTTISYATIIHVPNDYPTIQLAINNSTQGDTIIVGDGVYTENVQVNVGVYIISENGPENCTFFYSDNVCGFTLDSGALISGFWFKGKGRVNFNGSGTVRNSIFTDIYENNCNPYFISASNSNIDINIIKCQFRDNYSSCTSDVGGDGRGLINIPQGYTPTVNIDSCVFINNIFNYSSGQGPNGGAIYMYNGTMLISNSQFISNKIERFGVPTGQGGAIYSYINDLSIMNCYFYDNLAEVGSAVYIGWYNTSFSLYNSTFENNTNTAIVNMATSNSTVRNCNFINNMNGIYNDRDNLFFDADSNWWGSSSGPYHPTYNTSGLGDSVNIYVDVIPFYTEQNTEAPLIRVQNVWVDTFGIDFVTVMWNSNQVDDLAGYFVYLNPGYDGYPYMDTIDVSIDTTYTLTNLVSGSNYSVSVTCYDSTGNESWYSDRITINPTPVPIIATNLSILNFDTVLVGDTTEIILTLYNTGTAELSITDISTQSSQFISGDTSLIIPTNSQRDLSIQYIPYSFGFITDTLTIFSNAYNASTYRIPMEGFGDLSPSPNMLSIVDVPGDQGGQIRLSFSRSKYDGVDTTQQIVSYSVWRHYVGTEWDAVGMFNAVQDTVYHYVSPTLCDSTAEGICWSTFKVSAHTEDANVFYWSDSMNGFSIDNIAPGVPTGLLATVLDEGIMINWDMNPEEDFQYYKIYRSNEPDFDPLTMDSYFETIDTSFTDVNVEVGLTYYYRISAVDYAGNESEYSEIVEATILGIDGQANIPKEFGLKQNYPNPFNPSTTILYELPKSVFVKISIYNITGQLVESLVNEQNDVGYHSVIWNASGVGSGLYLYRIETGDFTETRKCVILK